MTAAALVPWHELAVIPTVDASGTERSAAQILSQISAVARPFQLAGPPLSADLAAELFRRLAATPRRFCASLALEAIERKSVLEDAARSGCFAIEVCREGPLASALAAGIGADRAAYDRVVTALRRARGLGMATVARIDLGRPGDDEGAFERTLRLLRRALVSIPIVTATPPDRDPAATAAGDAPLGSMDAAALDNGIRWTIAHLNRHTAIWRRALWPAGARLAALRFGYALRRAAIPTRAGRYTATMHLLRLLNRTKRARPRGRLLSTLPGDPVPERPADTLRVRATSNERLAALFIAVEGALDVAGARALLQQVRKALHAGYQRITIDFQGLEWVSTDVVTRFLAENRARFSELARWTRLQNLHGVANALRRQLGDVEGIRLIEVAAAHG